VEKIQNRTREIEEEREKPQKNEGLPRISDADFFSTIKEWESLYPHTYGDELLNEIVYSKKNVLARFSG